MEYSAEAYRIQREIGDVKGQGISAENIACCLQHCGDYRGARARHREALFLASMSAEAHQQMQEHAHHWENSERMMKLMGKKAAVRGQLDEMDEATAAAASSPFSARRKVAFLSERDEASRRRSPSALRNIATANDYRNLSQASAASFAALAEKSCSFITTSSSLATFSCLPRMLSRFCHRDGQTRRLGGQQARSYQGGPTDEDGMWQALVNYKSTEILARQYKRALTKVRRAPLQLPKKKQILPEPERQPPVDSHSS